MSELKIITEPSVFLVGQSQVNESELSRFLESEDVAGWTTDTLVGGERLVEVAGRTCFMSFAKPRPGGNSAYIGNILDHRHGSVAEHSVFNLIITGVSRSLTHEFIRHRAGFGYSELSQRYVDASDLAFIVPPALMDAYAEYRRVEDEGPYDDAKEDDYWAGQQWNSAILTAQGRYCSLVTYLMGKYKHITNPTERRKAAREAARSVLPNATETKIFVTGNARSWRHFIELRGSRHADAEIRRLALEVLKVLTVASRNLFSDFVVEPFDDGEFEITSKHPKV